MKLRDEDFIKAIEFTPLISVDFIVRNSEGSILMGKRKNQPAFDSWFVPGGRVEKGETIDRAIARMGNWIFDISLHVFSKKIKKSRKNKKLGNAIHFVLSPY